MQDYPIEPPSLAVVDELEYGVWKATVYKTALELDIFSLIAQGHCTLSDIVSTTGWNERGIRTLLDALCPLGLLSKAGDEYLLTPVSDAYLVRGSPTYYGEFSLRTQLAWEIRGRSAEVVRKGIVVGGDFTGFETEGLWAMGRTPTILNWPNMSMKIKEMWETLGVSAATRPGPHILDAACGSGVKSFILALSDPNARVTALDFPKVLEVAIRVAEAMGVSKQVSFLPGNILSADLGFEQFDIILFGAILYYFSFEQRSDILARAFRALKPGGLLVINEAVADEARCQGELALMAAFQLLLFAPQSQVYTFSEYKEILGTAGFAQVEQPNDQLISALKPSDTVTG